MNLSAGVSLGQLLLAFSVILLSGGIAWGGVLQRIKTLEKEVEALSGFAESLARVDERTTRMATDITAITNSWLLRDPVAPMPTSFNPSRSTKPSGARKPKA